MDHPSPQAKFLKETREKKGISLEAVHEGTKIPMDALKAIEEGYKIRTLSPFYYKGFIKMYAHYLGVDLSPMSDTEEPAKENPIYRTSIKNFPRPSEAEEKREFIVKMVTGALVVLIVCLLLFKMVAFLMKKVPFKKSDVANVEKNIRQGANKIKKDKGPKTNPENALKSTSKQTVPPAAKPAETFSSASTPATTSLAKTAKKIALTVRAKKNTWLKVKADKETVFQSTLKKGVAETWVANESIEISGGNINQLEFELNGKMLGSLGREDRLANKIVVTKNGLSVKK